MKRISTLGLGLLTLSIAACGGTSESARALTKVSGKVLIGTKPVSGALVQFVPTATDGESVSARTGADGTYQLVSARGEAGGVPGTYKITVTRLIGADGKELPEGSSPFSSGGKESIPETYTNLEQSPLMAKIPADKPEATIDFTLQGSLASR